MAGTGPRAGLLMSIMSPLTKDTAFSKGENLHQACHLTHRDSLYSTKQMGEDEEEFRNSLHNTRMKMSGKLVTGNSHRRLSLGVHKE